MRPSFIVLTVLVCLAASLSAVNIWMHPATGDAEHGGQAATAKLPQEMEATFAASANLSGKDATPSQPDSTPAASAPEQATIKALRRELAKLERRITTLELNASQPAPSGGDGGQAITREDVYSREQNIFEEEARIVAEQYQRLETDLATEIIDEQWAAEMSREIEVGLSRSVQTQGIAPIVECRSTICRIEAQSADGGPIGIVELYRAVPGLSNSAPHAMTFMHADGSKVLFLGRSGFPLDGT